MQRKSTPHRNHNPHPEHPKRSAGKHCPPCTGNASGCEIFNSKSNAGNGNPRQWQRLRRESEKSADTTVCLECGNVRGSRAEHLTIESNANGTRIHFVIGGTGMNPIRVMITDDHLIVREGLRIILETADDLEVVGEATDGAECLRLVPELAARCHPDGFANAAHGRHHRHRSSAKRPSANCHRHPHHLQRRRSDDPRLAGWRARISAQGLEPRKFAGCDPRRRQRARPCSSLRFSPACSRLRLSQQPKPDFTRSQAELHADRARARSLAIRARGERNKEIAYKLGITERTVKAHLQASIRNLASTRVRRQWLSQRKRGC